MTKMSALVQVIFVVLIVVYSTTQLFMGHFEQAMAPFPLLLLYYVFVIARQKRRRYFEDDDEPSDG